MYLKFDQDMGGWEVLAGIYSYPCPCPCPKFSHAHFGRKFPSGGSTKQGQARTSY